MAAVLGAEVAPAVEEAYPEAGAASCVDGKKFVEYFCLYHWLFLNLCSGGPGGPPGRGGPMMRGRGGPRGAPRGGPRGRFPPGPGLCRKLKLF